MSGTSTRSQGYDAGRAHHAGRVLEQAGRSAGRCQARCEALVAVTLNHLGVEVADAGAVNAEQARLAEAGLGTESRGGRQVVERDGVAASP